MLVIFLPNLNDQLVFHSEILPKSCSFYLSQVAVTNKSASLSSNQQLFYNLSQLLVACPQVCSSSVIIHECEEELNKC